MFSGMATKSYCIFVAIFLSCLHQTQCRTFHIWSNAHRQGACTYKGYIPGGGKPNIKAIETPQAKLPKSVLGSAAGITSMAAAGLGEVAGAIDSLRIGGNFLLKIAPKLAPALGAFGFVFGFIADLSKPSPQDIIDQTNKAIAKLTKEVNDRLEKMKGYVDHRVITLERDLINREYKVLFNLFAGCIKEATKNNVNRCMRNAERTTAASAPKFMILASKMGIYSENHKSRAYYDKYPSKAPSYYNIKRMEAGILSFRDYANIHLLMISTLLETYKSDPSLSHASYYVRLYTREQLAAVTKYIRYLKWATQWIYQRNVGENWNGHSKQSCSKAVTKSKGFILSVPIKEVSYCSIECTGMNIQAVCRYDVTVLLHIGPENYHKVNLPTSSPKAAAEYVGYYYGKNYVCKSFLSSLRNDIITVYKNTLLSSEITWVKIAAKASTAVGDEVDHPVNRKNDENLTKHELISEDDVEEDELERRNFDYYEDGDNEDDDYGSERRLSNSNEFDDDQTSMEGASDDDLDEDELERANQKRE